MNDFVILTTTELFKYTHESEWLPTINKMIEEGYRPLGGTVHFGRTGLMQTMYREEKAS